MKLLLALAQERTHVFDDAYRTRYKPGASSTVDSTKKKLMEDGHIESPDGKICVADPFLPDIFAETKADLRPQRLSFPPIAGVISVFPSFITSGANDRVPE